MNENAPLDGDRTRYFPLTAVPRPQFLKSEVAEPGTGAASLGANFNTWCYRSPLQHQPRRSLSRRDRLGGGAWAIRLARGLPLPSLPPPGGGACQVNCPSCLFV